MIKKLKINNVRWIDGVNTSDKDVIKTLEKYNIHELDLEACLEGNQRARLDVYDDYAFLILHFPKYNRNTKVYELNEFNIFFNKEFIISFREFNYAKITHIFENFWKEKLSKQEKDLKITPAFILYEVIQAMLEKVFNMLKNIRIDVKKLEKQVFDEGDTSLVKEILNKKRNIVILKHMCKPQILVLRQLELYINKNHEDEFEVYFEDLEDKLNQIVNHIEILSEYIDSIEDAFKSTIDIKTNFVIKVLTIFSAFLLPLTLITSFYGMNIDFPTWTSSDFVYILLAGTLAIMFMIYLILKKTWKF